MRKLFFMFAIVATLFAVGCQKYNDKPLKNRVGELENRVAALEELCKKMNTNISSLQTIVGALQNNDYVTSVTPVTKNGETIGYTIAFSKSAPITIYHGENGKDGANGADGKDGHTPVIGVRQDSDGVYYWTLDGEWLLDGAGNKVKAEGRDGQNGADGKDGINGSDGKDGQDGKDGENGKDGADGKDGITPQLKIENGYWYVSTDNGATWTNLGKATGEDGANGTDGKDGIDGDSFFKSITQDEDNVYFTLADGTIITIPKKSHNLFERLRSVHYIPRYDDGKALVITSGSNNTVEMDFEVHPKNIVSEIIPSWQSILSVKAVYTETRTAIPFINMPILSCEADTTNGIISITVSANDLDKDFFNGMKSASARFSVSDENDEISSEYVPLMLSNSTVDAQVPPTNEIWYTTTDEKVIITTYSDRFNTVITSNTYKNGKGIIQFAESITSITPYLFYNCDRLTSVIIPDCVTIIREYAFAGCSNLTSITIPDNVKDINDSAFAGCSSLTSITIPDSVNFCGFSAFSNCSNLTAFYGRFASEDNRCLIYGGDMIAFAPADLVEYTIPNCVSAISQFTFAYCNNITSINIPNSVTSIECCAFYGCSSLTNITISDNVTYIGECAFGDCSSLTSINIPNNVTTIGHQAFEGCSSLISITIPDGITSIEERLFYGCSSLTSITIPNSVTSIGYCAFDSCSSLTNISIPDSVSSIGEQTFFGCRNLTSITIGKNVTSIGNEAFLNCVYLRSIYVKTQTPPTLESESNNILRWCTLYVPTGCKEAYATADYWKDAKEIIEMEF